MYCLTMYYEICNFWMKTAEDVMFYVPESFEVRPKATTDIVFVIDSV